MRKPELSIALIQVLRRAAWQARALGHSYVGTEHFLLSLLTAERAGGVLRSLGWEECTLRSVLLLERHRRRCARGRGAPRGGCPAGASAACAHARGSLYGGAAAVSVGRGSQLRFFQCLCALHGACAGRSGKGARYEAAGIIL